MNYWLDKRKKENEKYKDFKQKIHKYIVSKYNYQKWYKYIKKIKDSRG